MESVTHKILTCRLSKTIYNCGNYYCANIGSGNADGMAKANRAMRTYTRSKPNIIDVIYEAIRYLVGYGAHHQNVKSHSNS